MSGSADLPSALARPSLEVAPLLLGAVLRHGAIAVRLTEVEAYQGEDDPGSHAGRGPTARNDVMYGDPGRLYVYLIYGMHHCANVVAHAPGAAGAVLLRAGEVVDGLAEARWRRPNVRDRELARGPARLCRTLGIDLTHNRENLATGRLTLELPAQPAPPEQVSTGSRVGLRHAADRPWRFWLTGDPTVSPYRSAPALERRRRRG